MANFFLYKLLDACREKDCPLCRVEQESVERYLENQFYENVNSPKWRDRLRSSLGFCHEHAWLAVDRRLGDALGFSIVYRDLLNTVLTQLEDRDAPGRSSRHWTARLRQIPEQARGVVEHALIAMTSRRRCPACEHREETGRQVLSALLEGLEKPELIEALQASDGLCLPHLQQALEKDRDLKTIEVLLAAQQGRMSRLRAELDEYIRKNDYRDFHEGFGREGDAWLRAVALVAGRRRK